MDGGLRWVEALQLVEVLAADAIGRPGAGDLALGHDAVEATGGLSGDALAFGAQPRIGGWWMAEAGGLKQYTRSLKVAHVPYGVLAQRTSLKLALAGVSTGRPPVGVQALGGRSGQERRRGSVIPRRVRIMGGPVGKEVAGP